MINASRNGDIPRLSELNESFRQQTNDHFTYPHAVHSLVQEQAAKQYCLETTVDDMEAQEHLLEYDDRIYMIDEAIETEHEPEALNLASGFAKSPTHHYAEFDLEAMVVDRNYRYQKAKQRAEELEKKRRSRAKLKLRKPTEQTQAAEENRERDSKKSRINGHQSPAEPPTALGRMLADESQLLPWEHRRPTTASFIVKLQKPNFEATNNKRKATLRKSGPDMCPYCEVYKRLHHPNANADSHGSPKHFLKIAPHDLQARINSRTSLRMQNAL